MRVCMTPALFALMLSTTPTAAMAAKDGAAAAAAAARYPPPAYIMQGECMDAPSAALPSSGRAVPQPSPPDCLPDTIYLTARADGVEITMHADEAMESDTPVTWHPAGPLRVDRTF